MILSAYLTTGLAIKIFSRLSKADIFVHGKENLPPGPIIFVVNHFTRIETLLLPYSIYQVTQKPVLSLAAASLFKGGLEKFFSMVGVVSTDDPRRDELIIRNLLTGASDWIIFPEGSMIKTKKIVQEGRYMVADPAGMREPHTGAAALAMRAELLRRHLLHTARSEPGKLAGLLAALGIEAIDEVATTPVTIVPVNLTYYPIRTAENIALQVASRLVKDMSERMVEEIMTEGTMLLSGVDLDIRFGAPLAIAEVVQREGLEEAVQGQAVSGYGLSPLLKEKMRPVAYALMQRYMHDIYTMTTINHEHLLAAFLRMYPFKEIRESELKRRIFYAASLVTGKDGGRDIFFLHRSLRENQAHLLTDDRYRKFANFFALAEEKGILTRRGDQLVCDRCQLSGPLSAHRGRIDNPIEVMANEVEPLTHLFALLRRLARLPSLYVRYAIVRYLLGEDRAAFAGACGKCPAVTSEQHAPAGQSIFLPSWRRNLGVVLVHSYLANPARGAQPGRISAATRHLGVRPAPARSRHLRRGSCRQQTAGMGGNGRERLCLAAHHLPPGGGGRYRLRRQPGPRPGRAGSGPWPGGSLCRVAAPVAQGLFGKARSFRRCVEPLAGQAETGRCQPCLPALFRR
jgi:1-acyl-sn-glycerol-3-phosphate acyltransferase